MAVITEEPDSINPPKPTPQRRTHSSNPNPDRNPSTFWSRFAVFVSLFTLVYIFSSLSSQDPKSWFLALPTNLRQHYSNGRTIKVQTTPDHPSIEVFTIQDGPINSDNVLIVHGLGCSSYSFGKLVKSLGFKGVHAVALDLPGSGFSDKSVVVVEEKQVGGAKGIGEIYSEIREKGLFWGFDQLVENGYVDYEESEKNRISKVETVKAIELGPEEMGRVLGQVIQSLGLAPVDLVLHDSAFVLSANWVSQNLGLVRSVTLLDSTSTTSAFPLWVLRVPVVREFVLKYGFVFRKVVESCCSKSGDAESLRILLEGRDGRSAVVGMGMNLNHSFDIAEWGALDGIKGLPFQVIWSSGWSEEWTKEGTEVAKALPQATFVMHSGGRWPQDDNADELAESIYRFVSSLPKSVKHNGEEPIPKSRIQKLLDDTDDSGHHHHDNEPAGFMNAYGLGHGLI